jgi:hypothetical protein
MKKYRCTVKRNKMNNGSYKMHVKRYKIHNEAVQMHNDVYWYRHRDCLYKFKGCYMLVQTVSDAPEKEVRSVLKPGDREVCNTTTGSQPFVN